jgi:hypothetical protein
VQSRGAPRGAEDNLEPHAILTERSLNSLTKDLRGVLEKLENP